MFRPVKPFPSYRWRWASLTPTEGLNEPLIFLGVLRVLGKNEGRPFNSLFIEEGLRRVQKEVEGRVASPVSLVREARNRNIFRNSQQYWKALGVLGSGDGVQLTPFGRQVSEGRIARDEFATTVVKSLELPNLSVQSGQEVDEWHAHKLRVKPLQLILGVMRHLGEAGGPDQAYLTRDELTSLVIPLAGDSRSTDDIYADAIISHRSGQLDVSDWPNCVPGANDARMAGEFLRFLAFYGFCTFDGKLSASTQFSIDMREEQDLQSLLSLPEITEANPLAVLGSIRESGAVTFVERQRVLRSLLLRPNQARFRNDVLSAFENKCLLTGERIPQTLEAAHIIPVEHQGEDSRGNGLCLRSDIHSLYDSGLIRLAPDGRLSFGDALLTSRNYRRLPRQVQIPTFVKRSSLEWRCNYQ